MSARPDPGGNPGGAVGVSAKDSARQAVWRVVGDANRVVVAVVGDHREHRSEDLFLSDPGVVAQTGDHGGLDEEADIAVRRATAAARERPALGDRRVEVALHPIPLPRRNQRPANGFRIVESPGLIPPMVAAAMETASS